MRSRKLLTDMLNKNYKVSSGFILLIFTMVLTSLAFFWAFSPLNFQRVSLNVVKGQNFYKSKEYDLAFSSFLKAAKLEPSSKKKSNYYRLAASSLSRLGEFDTSIVYFRKALSLDPSNALAEKAIEWLYTSRKITYGDKNTKKPVKVDRQLKEITYLNRYKDGWSMGRNAGAKVNVFKKNIQIYTIEYYTAGPLDSGYLVNIYVNDSLIKAKNIVRGGRYVEKIYLSDGLYGVRIEISETFNPKNLGWSESNRNLGVNFKIKKQMSRL